MAWNHYVTPFSYRLWLTVAIAACVLCVCLALTNLSNNNNNNNNNNTYSLSLIATVFYIPSCLCQQGQKANSVYGSFDLFYAVSCGPFLSFSFSFGLFLITLSFIFNPLFLSKHSTNFLAKYVHLFIFPINFYFNYQFPQFFFIIYLQLNLFS